MTRLRTDYTGYSDEALMRAVGRGEVPAFDVLYHRYSKRLLYYFYKMLGQDEDKAQDFLHDLFLKIVERPELFSPEKRFSTWVFSVAHNMCKNEYRRLSIRKTESVEPDDLPFEAESIPAGIDRKQFAEMLALELEGLSEEHRTVFILRYRENFSMREISDVLQCPEGTVKSRLFYAVRRLAARLKKFNPNETGILL